MKRRQVGWLWFWGAVVGRVGGACVALLEVAGLDLSPLAAAMGATEVCSRSSCDVLQGDSPEAVVRGDGAAALADACRVATVLAQPARRRSRFGSDAEFLAASVASHLSGGASNERRHESGSFHRGRELRWVGEHGDPPQSLFSANREVLFEKFAAVGVLEEVDATARLFEEALGPISNATGNATWRSALEASLAKNSALSPYDAWTKSPEEVALYAEARYRLGSARSSARCPDEPHPGGYVWLHSYGYAPLEPIHGEGVNGWRIVFGRVLAAAKRANASVILPCARHSLLVPCPVPRGLALRDPTGNSADDDYVAPDDMHAGADAKTREWLDLFAAREDLAENDDDAQDDASRGVRGLNVDDVSAYFDVDRIRAYLGAEPVAVDCAARFASVDLGYVKAAASDAADQIAAFLAAPAAAKGETGRGPTTPTTKIVKLGGGFTLGTLRSSVDPAAVRAVESGPLRGFAPRLHAEAAAFRALAFGALPVAVVHWRSETLVARRDFKAASCFQACADAVRAAADRFRRDGFGVLLVSDLPFDLDNVPSWVSFQAKLKRAHPDMPSAIRAFVQGFVKYDALLARAPRAAYPFIDLGDVGIVDQILAVDAQALATHYDLPNATLDAWAGVDFNDCGYSGRFIRTIVTRRLAAGRNVSNWYPPSGFPHLKVHSPAAASRPPKRSSAERLADED